MLRAVSKRVPSIAPALGRTFHTSNVRYTNAFFNGANKQDYYMKKAREEVAKNGPFEAGLLNQWGGVVPFVAALSAIGITKEVVLIDAEMLLSASMTAVYIGLYLAIGDTVKNYVKGAYDGYVTWFKDSHDAAIAGCGFYKAEQKAKLEAESAWKEYLAEYKEVMAAHTEAMALKPRHAAREKVLASLEAIRNREKLQASSQWRKFIAAYEVAIRETLADPDVQDDLFVRTVLLIDNESHKEAIDFQLKLTQILEDAFLAVDPALSEIEYPGGEWTPEDEEDTMYTEHTPEVDAKLEMEAKEWEEYGTVLKARVEAYEAATTDQELAAAQEALFEVVPQNHLRELFSDSESSDLSALSSTSTSEEEQDEEDEGDEGDFDFDDEEEEEAAPGEATATKSN